MQKENYSFLEKLLETPSPSGFEEQIQKVIKKRVSPYADDIQIDVHGNLVAAVNPDAKVRVMLAGHCDQIGFMVTHIDEQGYIWFGSIGGIDAAVLPGTHVIFQGENGPVEGIIGYKAVHLVPAGERGKPAEILKLFVDIGAKDGKEARTKLAVGDPGTYKLGVTKLGKTLIASPGCDDRVGAYVVMEALRLFKNAIRGKKNYPVGVFAVSTVQEEVGLRGAKTSAYHVDPHVGIAVDVTFASDHPGIDPKVTGTVKLGGGPVLARGPNMNTALSKMLVETAKKKKIPYQMKAEPGIPGTDTAMLQVNKRGVASALVSVPNRYMHTQVEVVDVRDLDSCAKLICETILRITSRTSFIPG